MSLRRRYLMSDQEFVSFGREINRLQSSGHGRVLEIGKSRRTPRRIPGLTPGPVNLSCSCLLVPVAVAVWWYWFKRKTRRVITRLLHSKPEATECERDETTSEFSSWEDVTENDSGDSSVHFVRWIKAHGNKDSTNRQRASIVRNSKRTLRLAASPRCVADGLTESILDDDLSLEANSSIESKTEWQGLGDENAGCMEAPSGCSVSNQPANIVHSSGDETGYCGGVIA